MKYRVYFDARNGFYYPQYRDSFLFIPYWNNMEKYFGHKEIAMFKTKEEAVKYIEKQVEADIRDQNSGVVYTANS